MNSANSELSANLPVLLAEQQKHLDAINRLILHSDLLVLVYGPEGAGKTLLSRSICCGDDNAICLMAEQVTALDDLYDVLAQSWQIDLPENAQQARQLIVAQSQQQAGQDAPIKLIIDDAHRLDAKLLKSIAKLSMETAPAVALALFGEVGFAQKLQSRLRKLPLYIYELTPLTLADCTKLFEQEGLSLSDDEVQTLYQVSDNWAGSLLTAAKTVVASSDDNSHNDDIFMQTHTETSEQDTEKTNQEESRSFGKKHIFALAGLAILLVMMLLYSQNYQHSSIQEIDLSKANESVQDSSNTLSEAKPDYNYDAQADKQEATQTTEVIDLRDEQNDDDKVSAPAKEIADAPSSVSDNKPKLSKKVEDKPVSTAQKKHSAGAVPPVNSMVIQLFGSYRLAAAKKFKHSLVSLVPNVHIYMTQRKQRNWYLVVMGDYANKAQARRAMANLMPKLKAQKPWIRSTQGLMQVTD